MVRQQGGTPLAARIDVVDLRRDLPLDAGVLVAKVVIVAECVPDAEAMTQRRVEPLATYAGRMSLVSDDFVVPLSCEGPGFRLEPLGPQHNDRDHEAWMSSIDHIRQTPDFPDGSWPTAMTLESNLADLVRHAKDFEDRRGFTYSILDGDDVIGCVYIYPSQTADAAVSSWVRASRAEMDVITWRTISTWLETDWPFASVEYGARPLPDGS